MREIREGSSLRDKVEWYAKIIIVGFVLAIIIKENIVCGAYVVGESMLPTLHEKDIIVLNKIVFRRMNTRRNDIVCIEGIEEGKLYIKRVIGLPGDKVEIYDGKVHLNGEKIKENYLDENETTHPYIDDVWEIPEDQVFVLGDNRGNSIDSRLFGLIDKKQIKGVGVYRPLPIERAGGID